VSQKAKRPPSPGYAALHGAIVGSIVMAILTIRPEFIFGHEWSRDNLWIVIGIITGGVYGAYIFRGNIVGFTGLAAMLCVLGENTRLPLIALPAVGAGFAFVLQLFLIIGDKFSALPRETNIVHHPGVAIYSDPECEHPVTNAKGIILKTTSADGAGVNYPIFPSTRTHFIKGKRVALDWSRENTWWDAWYRDPDTDEIKLAWNSSSEFVGRHLDEL